MLSLKVHCLQEAQGQNGTRGLLNALSPRTCVEDNSTPELQVYGYIYTHIYTFLILHDMSSMIIMFVASLETCQNNDRSMSPDPDMSGRIVLNLYTE